MSSQIDQIVQKTRRYWFEDGFVEIGMGVLFALIAAFLAIQELIPHDSMWFPIMVIGLPLVIIGASFPVKAFVTRLKERVTYPRTGYLSIHRDAGRNNGLALIAGAATAAAILLWNRWLGHEAIVAGLALGAAMVSLGWRFGVGRFYGLGVWAVLLGLAVSWQSSLSESLQIAALLAGLGAGLLISGLVVLRRYLDQHPPAQAV
jgi:hypothetical protein